MIAKAPRQPQGALVLRKACQSCTRAKRRCEVRLPKCGRCATRGLTCNYDLQPLVSQSEPARVAVSKPVTRIRSSPEARLSCQGAFCWLHLADLPEYLDKIVLMPMDHGLMHQNPSHPAMQVTVDADTEVYLLGQLRQIPVLAADGKTNPFIHPKARLSKVSTHIDTILVDCQGGTRLGRAFRDLVETDVAMEDLEGSMATVQSLLLYLATALSDPSLTHRAWGEGLLPLLRRWINILLVSAQEKMPTDLDPWRTWLLAESIRRTIITGFVLGCAYQHVRQGFCWHKLFVESLPFDRRPGLWAAQSLQAWKAAAGNNHASMAGERLISFHDFAVSYPQVSQDTIDDPLMRIILVAHFGKQRIANSIS